MTIGGAAAGAGNVISGNTAAVAIGYIGAIGNLAVIENNRIGTDATGAAAVPNLAGISITGNNNVIRGNTIAFNGAFNSGRPGVVISRLATGNLISQNSIVSNASLGIDLNCDGVTLNDVPPASNPPDQDTGGNNLQNFPILTSVMAASGGTQIQGTLTSTPNSSFRIEFFANRERDEGIFDFSFPIDPNIKRGMFAEGQTYLGFFDVVTNASGVATFTANVSALPADQDFVTATATDVTNPGGGPRNNTSEFSPLYPLGGPSTVVTNTGEVGVGTLREAIFVANLTPGDDTVTFNIPANDPRHFYYQNDGVAGRVSLAKIAVTTATNDAAIAGIDPDWTHSWFSIQPAPTCPKSPTRSPSTATRSLAAAPTPCQSSRPSTRCSRSSSTAQTARKAACGPSPTATTRSSTASRAWRSIAGPATASNLKARLAISSPAISWEPTSQARSMWATAVSASPCMTEKRSPPSAD